MQLFNNMEKNSCGRTGITTDSPLTPITYIKSQQHGLIPKANPISPGCGCQVGKVEEIYKVMQERGDAGARRALDDPVTREPVAVDGCSLNVYEYDPVTLQPVTETHWSLNIYRCLGM